LVLVGIGLVLVPQLWAQAARPADSAALEVLQQKCVACHGAAAMSDLDLRQRDSVLRGGKRGAAVVPGDPEASLLYQVVRGDGELKMPQGQPPLALEQIEALRVWIEQGARWRDDFEKAPEASWWAFRSPTRPAAPAVSLAPADEGGKVSNPIDAFVAAKLREKGLRPAPPADRRTLIRRAYFDLHGLPPSPEQVEEFVNDAAPDAWEKLVDRLLDSPRYGERWGRHWLDVVRYADTGGFETDIYFPNAWRYRDYVIQSFNDDKPYDRFVREQIAGEELWPDDVELRGGYEIPDEKLEHLEARIGTGLYTVGPVYHEAALDGEQLRYEWMTDAVDTTGEAFLGVTLGCARCHDHKFDPLSQRDYHRMMAVFAGSEIGETPVVSKMNVFGFGSGYPRLLQVEEYKAAVRRIDEKARNRVVEKIRERFSADVLAAYDKPANERTAEQTELAARLELAFTEAGLRENAAGKTADVPYTPEENEERERLIHELGKAALGARFEYPAATVLQHSAVVYPVHMTERGDFRRKGEAVTPGVPAVFGGGVQLDAGEPREGAFVPQRRKALALWLTAPDHPLTARVMVNRIWQHHFGRGIVATPNDFGRQGEPPTHPELLDWLAVEFMERGWSVKQMHRLILGSEAYRRSSEFVGDNKDIDAENRYLWRMNRRRVEAETLRDFVLAVSGSLNLAMGGRPVVPPLSAEEQLGMWAPEQWPVALDPQQHNRRSVYLYVKRSFPYPMFTTFDMPDTSVSCARRDVTTVAPQALALLNSEFMFEQAGLLAGRLRSEKTAGPREWIGRLWMLAVGREPSAVETEKALSLFASQAGADPEKEQVSALTKLCLLALNMNEFLYVE
jgi:cytochrome c553